MLHIVICCLMIDCSCFLVSMPIVVVGVCCTYCKDIE